MKKTMDNPSILPHLLSLGPFPSKRLLQNLTELTSQFQVEQGALTPAPGPLCLGAVCHVLRVAEQERVLQQWTKLQGLWHNSHKATPALRSWKWTCTTPLAVSPQQPSKTKVIKADSWGMPMENGRVCGSLTWNTPLTWDLSLILSNRYFTDTAKIEKGGKTMPYFFLISWVNIFSHFILGLGLNWSSFINL